MRTLCDLYCLYSSSQSMMKLSQSGKGHFMMHIEISMHLITCNPRNIWISTDCDNNTIIVIYYRHLS